METEIQTAFDRLGKDVAGLKDAVADLAPTVGALAEAEKHRVLAEIHGTLTGIEGKIETEFTALHKKFDTEIAADEVWVAKVADAVGAEIKTPTGIAVLCGIALLLGIALHDLGERAGIFPEPHPPAVAQLPANPQVR
jgi:hypothetical protein